MLVGALPGLSVVYRNDCENAKVGNGENVVVRISRVLAVFVERKFEI